jgi:hypothetical protein
MMINRRIKLLKRIEIDNVSGMAYCKCEAAKNKMDLCGIVFNEMVMMIGKRTMRPHVTDNLPKKKPTNSYCGDLGEQECISECCGNRGAASWIWGDKTGDC